MVRGRAWAIGEATEEVREDEDEGDWVAMSSSTPTSTWPKRGSLSFSFSLFLSFSLIFSFSLFLSSFVSFLLHTLMETILFSIWSECRTNWNQQNIVRHFLHVSVIRFLIKSRRQFAQPVFFFHENCWSKQINIWATFIFFYTTIISDRMMVLNPCQKLSRGALWLQICS